MEDSEQLCVYTAMCVRIAHRFRTGNGLDLSVRFSTNQYEYSIFLSTLLAKENRADV